MISEKTIIKNTSFWSKHTPWLLDYVRSEQANGRRISRPIDIPEDSKHVFVNNIIATTYYKLLCSNEKESIERAYELSLPVIKVFSEKSLKDYELSTDYKTIISKQADRLLALFGKQVVHDPIFPGYGTLSSCRGDLLVDGTLVEIKAHKATDRRPRPFEILDFRQLLVYCALNYHAGNKHLIKKIQLFNPRMAYHWQHEVDSFIYAITANSSVTFYESFAHYLTDVLGSPNIDIEM